ncbi:nucleotide disphospho-sugar-binding domain-containing protein [Nonomuraea angiospora]|uniref:UDP:flavonoid glycosyltransferase YjiC (YdhE family) n=1 Tax=Nonomuraea angiospora TaxID=46172 RepID=A0ABR9MCV7_9ACTN|nr:nucleotide disphospho-sugar-binding domain-containing protein [Nonomuraea angiospora]MBE1590765.1 UDP:flavonoid glycosyltransferase YjiC (YdhE family) [Nonomuraea angiospora]
MRILFTTVALPGHFFPLVPLAWSLRSLGHEVLVAAAENFVPVVCRSGLPVATCGPAADFVTLAAEERRAGSPGAGGIPQSVGARHAGGVPQGTGSPDVGGIPQGEEGARGHGRRFGRLAASGLPGMRALVAAWRPDLVVSERAEFAGPVAAAAHGVPLVEYQWGVAPLDAYREGAAEALRDELAAAGLAVLPEPDEVLNPWPPSLRLPHAAGHQSLRHIPYNGDAHVPAWAFEPGRRPRVCVTMGTLIPRLGPRGVRELVLPMLERLAELDVELLVAVDDAVVAGWPPLPPAVLAAGRMPLAHVLPGCALAINHGGQGSNLTALAAGCPQLVLPQFDDQFDNAGAVVRAGAGVSLPPEELTPEAVADRCRALLSDPGYGRAASAVAAEMAALPGPQEIADALHKLAS